MTFIGKTWRGIRRFVQDARIDADFHRYEAEQRVMYESTASVVLMIQRMRRTFKLD